MSLEQYRVPITNDHFEHDESLPGFSFPCCACIHRTKHQDKDPCGTCGHNLGADLDQQEQEQEQE